MVTGAGNIVSDNTMVQHRHAGLDSAGIRSFSGSSDDRLPFPFTDRHEIADWRKGIKELAAKYGRVKPDADQTLAISLKSAI
jgi:hypothetical protein